MDGENGHIPCVGPLSTGSVTGTGGGPQLNFKDIDPILLKFNNTKVIDKPIELDYEQTSKNFLHPVAGSEASKIGAGLFKTKTR